MSTSAFDSSAIDHAAGDHISGRAVGPVASRRDQARSGVLSWLHRLLAGRRGRRAQWVARRRRRPRRPVVHDESPLFETSPQELREELERGW